MSDEKILNVTLFPQVNNITYAPKVKYEERILKFREMDYI